MNINSLFRLRHSIKISLITYLVLQYSIGTNDVFKKVLRHMRVYGTEWVVEQIYALVLVDGTRERHPLLLAAGYIHTL